MQQTATAAPTVIRETTESVGQLGAYVFLTLAVFAFVGFLFYKRVIPQWIKQSDARAQEERERETWGRQQIEFAQKKLTETYEKVPVALAEVGQRMEDANRINRESHERLHTAVSNTLAQLAEHNRALVEINTALAAAHASSLDNGKKLDVLLSRDPRVDPRELGNAGRAR